MISPVLIRFKFNISIYTQFWCVLLISFTLNLKANGQKVAIPKVLSNISVDKQGMYIDNKGNKIYELPGMPSYSHENFTNNIGGSINGIQFNFKSKNLNGLLYYGFIP